MRRIVPAVFSVAVFPVILTAALTAALTTTAPDDAAQSRTGQSQTITVTLVNGHPPVLRWVKHLQESFVPAVEQALAHWQDTHA